MQVRQYGTTCLTEAHAIMSREWSKHEIKASEKSLAMRLRCRTISPDMSVSGLSYGTAAQVLPEARDEVLLIKMPVTGTGVARFADGDVSLRANAYAIVDVKTVQQVAFSEDYDGLVLRVRLVRVLAQVQALLGRRPSQKLRFMPSLAQDGAGWNDWQPVVAVLTATLANPSPTVAPAVLASIEAMVLTTLLVCQPNTYSDDFDRTAGSIAPRHVVRAERYIHDNIHAGLTAALVAAQVRVSIRTLFNGFRAFRGLSPAEYIRSARLDRARDDLVAGEDTVSEIAAKWGFMHAANFAACYRARFGEAPGVTRRFRTH